MPAYSFPFIHILQLISWQHGLSQISKTLCSVSHNIEQLGKFDVPDCMTNSLFFWCGIHCTLLHHWNHFIGIHSALSTCANPIKNTDTVQDFPFISHIQKLNFSSTKLSEGDPWRSLLKLFADSTDWILRLLWSLVPNQTCYCFFLIVVHLDLQKLLLHHSKHLILQQADLILVRPWQPW